MQKNKAINNLDEDGLIEYYCGIYNVNPYIAMAISRYETGHYKSELCIKCHNYGGLTNQYGLMKFNNKIEGIERFVKNLSDLYIKQGLTTLETIQPKYCPTGGQKWIDDIRSIYMELYNEK